MYDEMRKLNAELRRVRLALHGIVWAMAFGTLCCAVYATMIE